MVDFLGHLKRISCSRSRNYLRQNAVDTPSLVLGTLLILLVVDQDISRFAAGASGIGSHWMAWAGKSKADETKPQDLRERSSMERWLRGAKFLFFFREPGNG